MQNCSVIYVLSAEKKLYALDRSVAKRIAKKIKQYSTSPNPLNEAKPLSGILKGFYRYRVGDYRIIFCVDTSGVITVLTILDIAHRKDVYRKG